MKQLILMLVILLSGLSCTQKKNDTVSDNNITRRDSVDIHTAANSLDYWGTYVGTLPSASGEGMETTLTLRKDNTYLLKTVYVGRGDNSYEEKGEYAIDGNIITLKDRQDGDMYYKVGENKVSVLDREGKDITGSLAEQYVLTKK